jgi:hypothetical protein
MSINGRRERQNNSKWQGRNKHDTNRRQRDQGGDYWDHYWDVVREWELGRERSDEDPKAYTEEDLLYDYKRAASAPMLRSCFG